MSPTTRFIFRRIPSLGILFLCLVLTMALFPLWAGADEDPCGETGMYIGNKTNIDLWYTRDGGPCIFWAHDHILMIKPGETLFIYRDMNCKETYCPQNSTYDDYESVDADHNCRVKILPDCTSDDM